jgi:hypothetical protein
MGSRTQGLELSRFNPGAAQFKLDSLDARIVLLGEHGATLAPIKKRARVFPAFYGSADFQSAVSQIFNLLGAEQIPGRSAVYRIADCKSAIRQIENLRYLARPLPTSLVKRP